MSTTFQTGADQGTAPTQEPAVAQGTTFTAPQVTDPSPAPVEGGTNLGISVEELSALRKRDEHAQNHISTLESEAAEYKAQLAELQAKLDQASSVDELLREREQSTVNVDEVTSQAVDRVKAALASEKAATLAQENFNTVSKALTEKYGKDVDVEVQRICAENDMSFEDMAELSRKNPKLALKLCGSEAKASVTPSSTSTINSNAVLDNYQSGQQAPKKNVMELRTSKELADNYEQRLKAHLSKQN